MRVTLLLLLLLLLRVGIHFFLAPHAAVTVGVSCAVVVVWVLLCLVRVGAFFLRLLPLAVGQPIIAPVAPVALQVLQQYHAGAFLP